MRRKLAELAKKGLSEIDAANIERRLNIYCSRAVIFADEGREAEITKRLRKMHIDNRIPSKLGDWGGGNATKNITTDRIIEDPVFKDSSQSYFIQLADCIAFALLKREVPPTPNIKKYGIHKMFDETLTGICFKDAARKDPLGIVRK